MRPIQVVKPLPFLQLLLQIHVAFVGQKLVELLLVCPVKSLDLTVLYKDGVDEMMLLIEENRIL